MLRAPPAEEPAVGLLRDGDDDDDGFATATAGDFVGDAEPGTEGSSWAAAASGHIPMFAADASDEKKRKAMPPPPAAAAATPPAWDPLGASGRSAPPPVTGASDGGVKSGSGSAPAPTSAGDVDTGALMIGSDADDETTASMTAAAAASGAWGSDELGYICPEPLDDGVMQSEELKRFEHLTQQRKEGRLARHFRIKKPRPAGFSGMVRCYIRRFRDGWGAGKEDDALLEWRRVVAEVFGEEAGDSSAQRWRRGRRLHGEASVVEAARARDGIPIRGGGYRHYYELRRERDHSLIMAAVCVDESGGFVLTRRCDDVRTHGVHYIGSVYGDRLGTRFFVHDFGMPAAVNEAIGDVDAARLAEVVPPMARRILAEVHFDSNIMGTVPNSCSVLLNPAPANGVAEDLLPKGLNRARLRTAADVGALGGAGLLARATRFVTSVFEAGAAALFAMDGDDSPLPMPTEDNSTSRALCAGIGRSDADAGDAHSREMAAAVAEHHGARPEFKPSKVISLSSRQPDWNEELDAWTMDFRGRATLASKKNFQLVTPRQRDDEEPRVLFLMGKRGKDIYSLDFAYPLSPTAAFGIALTTFAQKFAVA